MVMAVAFWLLTACGENGEPEQKPAAPVLPAGHFALGADISWVTEMESRGMKFYGAGARPMECTELLSERGFNSIRLRVWVDPKEGWCNVEDVLVKALRAEALGMGVMVDFHYSDTWADPGHQLVPEVWRSLGSGEMASAVAEHTREVLSLLKSHEVKVLWVQVGNETSDGMLWPTGRASRHPSQYAALTKAGAEAVREVYPKAKVIVHLDAGHDIGRYNQIFDILEKNEVRYDLIGMSVYPYWAQLPWKQCVDQAVANMSALHRKYGKEVMVCETGMPVDEPEEAYLMLKYLLLRSAAAKVCRGVFYWEPEAPAGYNGGYRLGAFVRGRPTKALKAFEEFSWFQQ